MTEKRPVAQRFRVAMCSNYLPSESKIGAGYMAHRLAQVLQDRGHDVTMFSPCRAPEDARYHHRHLPLTGSMRTFRWASRLRRADFTGFDIVHAHGDDHLLVGTASPPRVRTMHGSCLEEAVHIKGAKERLRMLALGLTEVASSLEVRATVADSHNTTRWYPWIRRVIPNGVDRQLFHPGDKETDPTIVFVGTYHQRKRGQLLMECFARDILPEAPDAKLWMVCSDAPAAPGVEILGRLDDDQLADRMRRAWVFCLPSSYEGFGVPYIEAMASGTSVVATPNPGALEVLDGGRYGVIVPPSRLGTALRDLLGDGARRRDLASKGVQWVEQFDWARVAASYESVYQEVAGP